MNEGFLLIGAWAESELGLEVLSLDGDRMELAGQSFSYEVRSGLRREPHFLHLYFQSLDQITHPILLLTVGDDLDGWRIICRAIRQMEEQPLSVG